MTFEQKLSNWGDTIWGYLGDNWVNIFVIPILILIALAILGSSKRSTKTQVFGLIGTILFIVAWYMHKLIHLKLNSASIIGLVVWTGLFYGFGYRSYINRNWFVTFEKSKPIPKGRIFLASAISHFVTWVAVSALIMGIDGGIAFLMVILIIVMVAVSGMHSVPLRQIWVPTVFNKPTPQWAMKTGFNWLWRLSSWLPFVDIIPISVAKRDNRYTSDELPTKAMSSRDRPKRPGSKPDKEAVAAGVKFKIEYREVHKLDPYHQEYPMNLNVFLEMDDDERNNVDAYIRSVIEDWMADYLQTQEASDIMEADFMREDLKMWRKLDKKTGMPVVAQGFITVEEYRDMNDFSDDEATELYNRQRKINLAIQQLRDKILKETGLTLEVIGIIDRTPDKEYEKAIEEFARKRAEEQTALRDIDVQTAQGKAFIAKLRTIKNAINADRRRNGEELLTIDDVWQLTIENERARRAASHVVGLGPLGGLLSRYVSKSSS